MSSSYGTELDELGALMPRAQDDGDRIHRRAFFRVAGRSANAAAALLLAGCLGGASDDGDDDEGDDGGGNGGGNGGDDD
jgi:hypothetical protein